MKAFLGIFQIACQITRFVYRGFWYKLLGPIIFSGVGVKFGRGLRVLGMPIISMCENSEIRLGENVKVYSNSRFTPLGVSRPCIFRTMGPGALIEVGSNVGMSGVVLCSREKITIGDDVLLGSGVMIVDSDFHPLLACERNQPGGDDMHAKHAPVVVESRAFLGMNSIILKGVHIGADSVVAAGSVVTKDVEPGTIVAGNPAVLVKRLDLRSTEQLSRS
ncbi:MULTISPECIES: DapH/DapD/GlmU-related protein [unclassified Lentimonas]|uniref:acyltransferase n=1 Tax=unclassified Lentimonas TaxID=2630993 RepID=UPI0013284A7E|nr:MULTISPECIES: acyltransferase [unclassified Lentimonas]CAA6680034.1 Unannotated [Lentimonas sp. CC4]CAA6685153.1 Unannotated [Lentimonas sp. CC6]CAA7075120.1 Unannotated [Lentimonas sp. CC4]CAA7168420.1 Unannotated [Lentimonas sp. CC21]CAA7182145.1 Unannotated [Lentimonas sp. CC8]